MTTKPNPQLAAYIDKFGGEIPAKEWGTPQGGALSQPQAAALHDAIKALNSLAGRSYTFNFSKAIVRVDRTGAIVICAPCAARDEEYGDVNAFAKAYGVDA